MTLFQFAGFLVFGCLAALFAELFQDQFVWSVGFIFFTHVILALTNRANESQYLSRTFFCH